MLSRAVYVIWLFRCVDKVEILILQRQIIIIPIFVMITATRMLGYSSVEFKYLNIVSSNSSADFLFAEISIGIDGNKYLKKFRFIRDWIGNTAFVICAAKAK